MKIHSKHIVLSLLLFISLLGNSQDKYNRGLYFRSFEVDQDNRTGLNLTPDNKIVMTNGFKLKFDIKLRQNSNDYGYVFRLVGNDSVNIDLIAHITTQDYLSNYAFSLVNGANSIIKVRNSEIKNFKKNIWLTIYLNYDKQKNKITLILNDLKKSVSLNTEKLSSFNLYFGFNNNPIFATTDVPPMTIRNIQIFDDRNELKRNWKLEKHALDNVYDECQNKKAIAVNPIWEIDKHAKWQLKAHLDIPYNLPQFTFSEDQGRIYIVKRNSIFTYDAINQTIDSLIVKKGEPYNCSSNQLFFDKNSGKLISYNFNNANLSKYDFRTNEWSNDFTQSITPQFWHHSKFFDVKDSTLVTVGGYGYHKYKSDVMRYSFKNREWNQHDISSNITPRYLGSLGYLGNDELLYFGGYGSKTGNQVEFPHNYYDLYKINSKTLEVMKLWEMNSPAEHFTNSNSLVVNKQANTFYNLAYSNTRYSTSLKLMEYSIDKPEFKTVGDTIPYKFKDIESYCDLYYSPKTSELLAVTSISKNNKSNINIYSIAYPPLHAEDVKQEEETTSQWKWLFLLIPLLLIPIFYLGKTQKDKKDKIKHKVNNYLNFEYNTLKPELKPSSINMLGYFQLIDKDGVNITGNFTATTSQMLVLIILHTVKNGQGISTQELTEILWPDKDTDSARNNRNVYMSKLRLLIKNVGDIELANQNNYWSANIGNDVFCDYKNVMLLIDQIKKQKNSSVELVNELVNIVSRGVLLPNFQEEWIDAFKGDYTNLVIETLSMLLQNKEIITDQILVLHISDAILKHDSIDEDIAKLKVTTLFNLGKKSQAKQCFEKFAEDYKSFMGVAYKESFDQFREKNL
jgi:DNA-binding SARP family transcriptional activator